MQNCSACGEKIQYEARKCRHCNHLNVFEFHSTRALDDKETYNFNKLWQPLVLEGSQQLRFNSLKEAKETLQQSEGASLASDLTFAQIQTLKDRFREFPIAYAAQNPLGSLASADVEAAGFGRHIASLVYGLIGISILSASVYFGIVKQREETTTTQATARTKSLNSERGLPSQIPAPLQERAAPTPPLNQDLEDKRQNMARLLNSTVFIREAGKLGTGFMISPNGYILSNAHVTGSMSNPLVTLRNGQNFQAQKIAQDARLDIALIKISVRGAPYLEMGDANQLYAGQDVLTIGNPSGLSFTVTRGIVSHVGRNINGAYYIQTDAAINPGNSGGPMITDDLKVVGINTLTARVEKGISFALPINYAYDAAGIARNIGAYPRDAGSFSTQTDSLQVGYGGQKLPAPGTPDESGEAELDPNSYKTEAQEYAADLKRDDERIRTEHSQLLKEAEEMIESIKVEPNQSTKNRMTKDLAKKQERIEKLSENLRDAQMRYYKKMISLLQRQMGDPRFSPYSGKISDEILALREKEKNLRDNN